MQAADDKPLLELKNLKRYFGGVKAVDDISMTVHAGQIHGCGTEDFPGAPKLFADGRDVPYVTTYNFGFPVRFDRITGADGNLLIISGGDLLNLISAANITQVEGRGVVSGTVRDTAGTTVAGVVLAATDADGNPVGDFFYNGLGGTPDFVQTRGTVPTGGFTIFNAKPGEVFLKAVSGGIVGEH